MEKYSTRQAAKKLGIGVTTLVHYIELNKVPAPKPTIIGRYEVRAWSEAEIERVRALLPKIANGRKTRYQKLKDKHRTQPRAAALQKKNKTKKKK